MIKINIKKLNQPIFEMKVVYPSTRMSSARCEQEPLEPCLPSAQALCAPYGPATARGHTGASPERPIVVAIVG
jgi:hypothetical protein